MHLYYNRQSTVVQVASSLIQYHDNMGYPAQNDKRLSHLIILIKKEPCASCFRSLRIWEMSLLTSIRVFSRGC